MPLHDNNVSNVVTAPENNIRNNTNATTDSSASHPSPLAVQHQVLTLPDSNTSEDSTAHYNNVSENTNSINDANLVPVNSINDVNPVPVHRAHDNANDVATVLGRDAIGYNANREEMQAYAKELDALGLHSIPMILRFCQGDHANEWPWMKPFHKMAFRAWLESRQAAAKATIAV